MSLVYPFYIKHTDTLDNLFKVSNNLYNQALYTVKQYLNSPDKVWLRYPVLDRIMKVTTNLEGNINYRLLKAQCSQQILRQLDTNLDTYFKALKDWKINPSKYKAMPKFPRYRKRGDFFNLYYTNQACAIKDGKIKLDKDLYIPIPQWDKYKDKIKSFQRVHLIVGKHKYDDIRVEIVYNEKKIQANVDKKRYAAIDLGINNLATMVTSDSSVSIYSGKFLKSYNKFFNKQISKLQSIKDKKGIKRSTKKIRRLYTNRDRFFKDVCHKISRNIVNTLISKHIGTLIVGYNADWKQEVNIGKKNNQTFVQIPFARLIDYLRYKCELVGIDFKTHEESYTSKCDALALEKICEHKKYLGQRVGRGLFRSSSDLFRNKSRKFINADVNGALNILRKVVVDSAFRQMIDMGQLLCPVRHRSVF